ncbi:dipeptidase PepE [Galbibacter sp. EGI 63066]|uniref:dipeptidase PepE n=1 Tax=Galbibacter sp. EGI 63066 TaxID=2993559 RepID=UPI00224977AA|nr:dipeptidase PepE [Galbibacter sp. EGI 63066]MCX2680395.1 dipeptidase PepE [Galbibacter sp. EGI 63066]
MRKLIIASTSTVYGSGYLEYILPELENFFQEVEEVVFIPYARPGGISHDEYTAIAQKGFARINKKIVGLHTFKDPEKALKKAEAVFTGGGNTFLLVTQLYKLKLMPVLRERIYEGMRYFGTSAGANITGLTMQTTNDMPIVYPPSFKTLGAVPFNINPHYIDPVEGAKHMGETRETRIKEFHKINTEPVIGLREGSWLEVTGDRIVLKGTYKARVFEQNKVPYEIVRGSVVEL